MNPVRSTKTRVRLVHVSPSGARRRYAAYTGTLMVATGSDLASVIAAAHDHAVGLSDAHHRSVAEYSNQHQDAVTYVPFVAPAVAA